jgi:hypothetical protein
MSRRAKVWRVLTALFIAGNIAGAGYAVAHGELLHTAAHVALTAAAYVAWQLATRPRYRALPVGEQVDERLEHLQQAVDAMAIEVERIGEAQRFMVKLQAERERVEG